VKEQQYQCKIPLTWYCEHTTGGGPCYFDEESNTYIGLSQDKDKCLDAIIEYYKDLNVMIYESDKYIKTEGVGRCGRRYKTKVITTEIKSKHYGYY